MSVTTRRVPVHSWLLAVTAGLLLAVPGPAHGAPTGGGPTGAGPIEITAPGSDTPAHLDGDPATTERLDERDVTAAAVAASQRRFAAAGEGGRHAAHVVVGRDDHFADSLAGTALTGDGPLLYTARTALTDATGGEIDRLLGPSGGRVYLLGGTAAIDQGVAEALAVDGRDVVRLAGATRIETALAVADAVRGRTARDEVFLARAYAAAGSPSSGWADSVAVGGLAAATGIPVLLTPTAALHPAVAAWLAADGPADTVLLGGEAALARDVELAVPNPTRVSGAERTATAAAIAADLWGVPASGPRSFVVADGARSDGWGFGLAAGGLASDAGAPVLLVTGQVTEATGRLAGTCGAPEVDLLVVGDASVVGESLRERLDRWDAEACEADGSLTFTSALQTFSDCDETLAYYRGAALERVGPWGLEDFAAHPVPGPVPVPAPGAGDEPGTEVPPAPADPIGEGDAGGDTPRSGTNNQEAGVDEPDLVKTDGRIAVAVARQRLQVVDLAGAAPRLVSTVSLPPGWSNDVLLEGSSALVVTGSDSYTLIHGTPGGGPVVEDGAASGEPSPGEYEPTTVLTRVDLTDPAAPQVMETLTLEGTYHSARLVDGVARVVLHTYPTGLDLTYPPDDTDEALQAAEEHNRSAVEQSTLANWLPSATRTADGDAETFDLLACGDVSRPPEFSGLGTLSVVSLALGQSLAPTSSAAILAAGESVYASRGHLYVSTSRWGTWQPERQGDPVTTEIHAFDIGDPAATSYVGSGSVEGSVLNQFSLSEHEGHLRVATTTEPVWSEDGDPQGESESGVTVLALQPGALVQVGHVGGLGRGERIFAVRFLGDAAAVVTFRQIDPLFLLDLSDPTSPRLTGELELPGVSNYLHPVGEGLLLGVGMDATLDGQITGAQISLFDISDPSAPTRLSHLSFPDAFTEVQSSHLAFLYWPATGLAVMPLEQYGADGGQPFVGAVGVHVDPVSGLRERGRLTHGDADPLDAGPWVGVRRSFVVGDTLYTVSDRGLEAGALDTLAERAYVEFSDG